MDRYLDSYQNVAESQQGFKIFSSIFLSEASYPASKKSLFCCDLYIGCYNRFTLEQVEIENFYLLYFEICIDII
jgi:hypothetical protein